MTTDDLLNLREVCEFFGGKGKPLDKSTIYRGISKGRFPKPFKITPRNSRWKRSECQIVLDAILKSPALENNHGR